MSTAEQVAADLAEIEQELATFNEAEREKNEKAWRARQLEKAIGRLRDAERSLEGHRAALADLDAQAASLGKLLKQLRAMPRGVPGTLRVLSPTADRGIGTPGGPAGMTFEVGCLASRFEAITENSLAHLAEARKRRQSAIESFERKIATEQDAIRQLRLQ